MKTTKLQLVPANSSMKTYNGLTPMVILCEAKFDDVTAQIDVRVQDEFGSKQFLTRSLTGPLGKSCPGAVERLLRMPPDESNWVIKHMPDDEEGTGEAEFQPPPVEEVGCNGVQNNVGIKLFITDYTDGQTFSVAFYIHNCWGQIGMELRGAWDVSLLDPDYKEKS